MNAVSRRLYLEIPGFLQPGDSANLLARSVEMEKAFVLSKTTGGDTRHRQSLVYYGAGRLARGFAEAVRGLVPHALYELGMEPFNPSRVELQLTASRDGDFFLPHRDAGHRATAGRKMTFVYYFFEEPARFTGGELFFLPGRKAYRPRNNAIVLFDSRVRHEVGKVAETSGGFQNARFTLNGWVW